MLQFDQFNIFQLSTNNSQLFKTPAMNNFINALKQPATVAN
jgi:hypothetical protein